MGLSEAVISISKKLDPLHHTICTTSMITNGVQNITKNVMNRNLKPVLIEADWSQKQQEVLLLNKDQNGVDKSDKSDKSTKSNNLLLQQALIKLGYLNGDCINHAYMHINTNQRFNLLYSFLKKSLFKKNVIFVQNVDQVNFLQNIFRSFEIITLGLHEKINDIEKTKIFFEFQNAKSGTLFVTESSLRGLTFHTHIDTILHYDNPVTPLCYLNRVLHFSVENNDDEKTNSIIFFTEPEKNLLPNFLTQITFSSNKLPTQVIDISNDLMNLSKNNFFINSTALKAYFSLIRHLKQTSDYSFKELNLLHVAQSFGLETAPEVKE
jgi:superfamily II DNA/RNA helicase